MITLMIDSRYYWDNLNLLVLLIKIKKGINVKKLSIAVLLTLVSANAIANETNNWDGFYGSVLVGYTDGDVKEKNGSSYFRPSGGDYLNYGGGKASLTGISGTLKIGYNKQIVNNNLIGLELGATFQNADSNQRMFDAYSDTGNLRLSVIVKYIRIYLRRYYRYFRLL